MTDNRARFPGFGEVVDELRAVFGDVKVRYVINRQTGDFAGRPHGGTTVQASYVPRPAPKEPAKRGRR